MCHNVLSTGATLIQAAEAYYDTHPLDHDNDVEVELGGHVFDEDDSVINTTMTFALTTL